MSVIVSTKLTIDDYVNLRKLCEQSARAIGIAEEVISRRALASRILSSSVVIRVSPP